MLSDLIGTGGKGLKQYQNNNISCLRVIRQVGCLYLALDVLQISGQHKHLLVISNSVLTSATIEVIDV